MAEPQQVNRPSSRMVATVTSLFVMLVIIFSVVPVLETQVFQSQAEPHVQNDRSDHGRRKLMKIMQPPEDQHIVPNEVEADTLIDGEVSDLDPNRATDADVGWRFADDDTAWIAGLKWPITIVALRRQHPAPIGIFVTGSGRFHAMSSSLASWLDRSTGMYFPNIPFEER